MDFASQCKAKDRVCTLLVLGSDIDIDIDKVPDVIDMARGLVATPE